ncbi:MAG: hypothetical protein ACO1TE_08460 [Prosthecobacter sp.]
MQSQCHFILWAVIALVALPSQAADLAKELENTREKYQADVEQAARPYRDKYVQELERMKNQALAQKNLPLALEIEKEIAAVAPAPRSSAVKTATDLERYLGDTTWSWGVNESAGGSTLTFRKDGTCSVNKDAPVRWAATDDSTVKLENGTILKFRSNNKVYTATTNAGPRYGKKL